MKLIKKFTLALVIHFHIQKIWNSIKDYLNNFNMIKVKTFGWRNNSLDVISRIESGLIENGHLLSDNPDIIYKNESFCYSQ